MPDDAAEAGRDWNPLLVQMCGDASRHLDEYLVSQGHMEARAEASPPLPNYTYLSPSYVDATATAQKFRADLEALGDLLIQMRSSAIRSFNSMIYCLAFLSTIATFITLLTPLHKADCNSWVCSTLSTLVWVFPGCAASDALFDLHLRYLIGRCRKKTEILLEKLAKGSLEPKDQSKLTGRFSWGVIGHVRR